MHLVRAGLVRSSTGPRRRGCLEDAGGCRAGLWLQDGARFSGVVGRSARRAVAASVAPLGRRFRRRHGADPAGPARPRGRGGGGRAAAQRQGDPARPLRAGRGRARPAAATPRRGLCVAPYGSGRAGQDADPAAGRASRPAAGAGLRNGPGDPVQGRRDLLEPPHRSDPAGQRPAGGAPAAGDQGEPGPADRRARRGRDRAAPGRDRRRSGQGRLSGARRQWRPPLPGLAPAAAAGGGMLRIAGADRHRDAVRAPIAGPDRPRPPHRGGAPAGRRGRTAAPGDRPALGRGHADRRGAREAGAAARSAGGGDPRVARRHLSCRAGTARWQGDPLRPLERRRPPDRGAGGERRLPQSGIRRARDPARGAAHRGVHDRRGGEAVISLATMPTGGRGRALALALAIAVLAGLYLIVAAPLIGLYAQRQAMIAARQMLLPRLQAVAAELPALRARIARLRAEQRAQKLTLDGATDAIASANLESRIDALARALGVTIGSTESLPAVPRGPYRRIGLRLVLTGRYEALVNLLARLETARPPLVVDNLQLHGPLARPGMEAAATLDAGLDVYGFRSSGKALSGNHE